MYRGMLKSNEVDILINQSLEGDKEAFSELFNHYRQSVKGLLLSLSNNDFDSNDLLQETFIKAFLNLAKYNNKYQFKVWLLSIAKNIFIDYVRRRSVKSYMSLLSYDDVHEIIDENIDIDKYDICQMVALHIEELAPKYRKIVELRYYIGYDYSEIAKELSIPEGTVKNRLYRAKQLLRDSIFLEICND